jgi:hypothetical protein
MDFRDRKGHKPHSSLDGVLRDVRRSRAIRLREAAGIQAALTVVTHHKEVARRNRVALRSAVAAAWRMAECFSGI